MVSGATVGCVRRRVEHVIEPATSGTTPATPQHHVDGIWGDHTGLPASAVAVSMAERETTLHGEGRDSVEVR